MFSTFFKLCFNAFFSLVVIAAMCLYYDIYSLKGLLLAPFFTLTLIIIGTSVGFLMAPFNVIYNDVGKLINISLRPLMFLSGTIFPISAHGSFAFLHQYNPVLICIEQLRVMITSGAITTSTAYWCFALGSPVLYLVAWYFFHVAFRMTSDKL